MPCLPERSGAARRLFHGRSWILSETGQSPAALYAHFRHPEVFGGALCMSPSFWMARQAIFGFVEGRPTPSISRVYLDCGAREARGRMLPIVARMADHLKGRGYPEGQLLWRPDSRGQHSERHWRRRAPRALRFMFRV